MTPRRKVPSATETAQINLPQNAVPATVLEAAKAADNPMPVRTFETAPPKMYPAKIASSIIKITREIGVIAKRGKNTFHHYEYAKWEDILDELAPMLAQHGLIIIPNEIAHNVFDTLATVAITYEFTIINEDGDVWPDKPRQTQLCKIKDGKGVIDDKAASKCFTQAQKYMMLALFKIRTGDMADADASDQQQVSRKRQVPSSNGKLLPSIIPIIDGESPAAWAERFMAAIAKADTEAEIDAWDKANDKNIVKVKTHDVETYNKIVDVLNKNYERVNPKPQQQQPAQAQQPKITSDERDWIEGVEGSFSGCEDIQSLDAEWDRLVKPQEGKVSGEAWGHAVDAYNEAVERIQA